MSAALFALCLTRTLRVIAFLCHIRDTLIAFVQLRNNLLYSQAYILAIGDELTTGVASSVDPITSQNTPACLPFTI